MKNNSIKTVVAVGIGAALFFVLGRFVAIPSPVPNTNISLQYAVLALLAACLLYTSYADQGYQEVVDERLEAFQAGNSTRLPENQKAADAE